MNINIDNLYIYTSNVLKPKIEIVNQNINSNLHTTSITGSLSNLINVSLNSNKILINNENITTSDINLSYLNYLNGLSESITTTFINSSNIINNSSNILINSINDIDTTLTTKYNTIDSNSSNYNSNIDIDITKRLENLNISNILNGTINKYIENNILNTDLIVNGNVNVLNGFITSNNVISSSKTVANEDLHIVSSSSNTALTIQQNNNQNTVEIYGNTGTKFIINNSGNIGIGKNPTTSNSLEIFGDINSTGLYSNSLPFSYSNLSNIPLEFTPSAHSHIITDISGLTTILDSKQTIINSLTSNNDTITINSGLNLSTGYTFKEDNVELKLQSSIITTTTSETTNYWNEKTISIVDNGVNKELLTVPNSTDKYYAFTSTSGANSITFTSDTICDILIVGGGGGGGMDMGGGGGGGGVISISQIVSPGTYNIIVGKGGDGAPAAGTNGQPTAHQFSVNAKKGGNSSFGTIEAIGGGYGGSSVWTHTLGGQGGNGGSGGGSSGYNAANNINKAGTGITGQGFRGGYGDRSHYSGGGGGAGEVGGGPSTAAGGAKGGDGKISNILGIDFFWGGGGGGAGYTTTGGNGGKGGGGGGAVGVTFGGIGGITYGSPGGGGSTSARANKPGGNGGMNTGGGGGGGAHYNSNNKGGDGGSGIVIIRIKQQTYPSNISYASTSINANSLVLRNYSSNIIPNGTLSQPISYDVVNSAFVYEFYPGSNYVSFPYDTTCDLLLVGGGGSGGTSLGTGGNSGNVIYSTDVIVPAGNYNIIVGEGGTYGKDGGDTTAFGATSKGGRGIIAKIPSGIKASVPPQPVIGNSSYVYYAFTAVGNGSITFSKDTICDVLVVGGGGGGTNTQVAGGAGACIVSLGYTFTTGSYNITVGNGGVASTNGEDSSIGSIFIAKGGGKGNADSETVSGGCSGGKGNYNTIASVVPVSTNNVVNGITTGPVVTATYGVYGNTGGRKTQTWSSPNYAHTTGTSGGGIGTAAENSTNTYSGKPGDGLYKIQLNGQDINLKNHFSPNSTFGVPDPLNTNNYYIGGGGRASAYTSGTSSTLPGSLGGGGGGYIIAASTPGQNGVQNTGSGGGGAMNSTGGKGGSGIVIIRVPVDDVIYEENGGVYRLNDNNIIDNNAVILNKFDTARQNLIAWYKFDGDFTDSSGNGMDLTGGTGTTFVDDRVVGTKSINFPKTSTQGLTSTVDLSGDKSFTITFWSYKYNTDVYDFFLSAGNVSSSSQRLHIGYVNTNAILFAFWGNDLTTPVQNNIKNTWVHLIFSYNSSDRKRSVYRNGVLIASDISTTPSNFSANTFFIGGVKDQPFGGKIDDFRIYNKALSKDEVEYIYSTTNTKADLLPYATSPAILYNNLRLWYKFSGKLGTIDSSIYSLNANATGTPVISDGIIKITKDNYLKVPDNVIDFNNDITICFWYRFDNGLANGRVFDFSAINNQAAHDNSIKMCRNQATSSLWFIIDTIQISYDFGHTTSGQMIHLTWNIKKNGIWYVYKNGISFPSQLQVYPKTNVYAFSYLGKSTTSGEFANDNQISLKDFRIYNRSLTEDEIYNIYNQVTTTSLVAYSPSPFIYNYDFYNDTTNMIAWYKFDGDFTDSSVNGNHLINNNVTANTIYKNNVKQGISSASINNNYLTNSSINFNGISFSVSFWVYRIGNTTNSSVISFGNANSAGNKLILGWRNATNIMFAFWANDLDVTVSNYTNIWTHITFTYNFNTLEQKTYMNGVNIGTRTSSAQLNASTGTFILGQGTNWGGNNLIALLDDLRIYNKTLSKEEVSLLYYSSSYDGYNLAKFYNDTTDMYAWYKFDGDLTDNSGNGKDLTGGTGTSFVDDSVVGTNSINFPKTSTQGLTSTVDLSGNKSFTIAFWSYKYNSGYDFFLSAGDVNGGSQRLHVGYIGTNAIKFAFWGNDLVTPVQNNIQNTWVHLIFSYNSSDRKRLVYLNGVLIASDISSGPSNFKANTFFIGGVKDAPFGGNIDDFRIYNRALTPSEIDIIYNQYTIDEPLESFYNNTTDMLAWYKFDGDFTDSSGNGKDLTTTSGTDVISFSTDRIVGSYSVKMNGSQTPTSTLRNNTIDLTGPNKSYTIAFWIKRDFDDKWALVSAGNSSASGTIYIGYRNSGVLWYGVIDNSIQHVAIESGTWVEDVGKWVHLVFMNNNQTTTIHRNGIKVGESVYSGTTNIGDMSFAIGAHIANTAVNGTYGNYDDFRIYNRALTPSEVALLANRFGGGGGSVATPGTFTTSGGIGGDALIIPMRYNESFAKGGDGFTYNTLSTTQGIGYGGTGSTSLIYNPGGRGSVIIKIPYQPYIIDADKYNQEPTQIPGTNDFYYAFTSTTGTNSITFRHDTLCDILVVGGGASGGTTDAGGGGAGGLVYMENKVFSSGTYSVVVGDGATSTNVNASVGNDGNPSYISFVKDNSIVLKALGGGGGGNGYTTPNAGRNGGSGGGGPSHVSLITSGTGIQSTDISLNEESRKYGFGNDGGAGSGTSLYGGGGGGGAGGPGSIGGNGIGGIGKIIAITGISTYYAGGGGGGHHGPNTIDKAGGLGGGGLGKGTGNGGDATANTGGGGGGGGGSHGRGGAGGSGIVIIRWTIPGAYTTNEKTNGGVYVDKGGISTVSGDITTYGGNVITNVSTINNNIILNTLGYTDKQWKIYGNNDNQFDLSFDRSNDTGNMWLTQAKMRGNGGIKGYVNFTGMHHCKASTPELYDDKYIGYIVSSTKQYQSMNSIYDSSNIQRNIDKNTWDALPIVTLSTEKDKKVFGIIAKVEDDYSQSREEVSGNIVNYFEKKSHDRRLHIAGVGEGGIWVCDYNNTGIESGDFITTSPIPGIGMKQDDDLVRSYTVGKATMDCDFKPKLISVKILTKIGDDYDKDSNGDYIYSDLIDESGDTIYEEEYEIKYVTIDGTVLDIDTNEYKNNTSNYPNVYKMAFIGCSYTCS